MKKTAVVTGASSGIGLAIATILADNGYQVVGWDLRPPKDDVAIPHVTCDVSREESVLAAHGETVERFGEVSVLVNNCGLQFMAPVDEFPVEKWNLLIGVLLTGTFLCSKSVIPGMRRMKSGRIINISSVHGKLASPFKSAYVSAKHGVLGLSKVMALECGKDGITVNSICPGFVDTPLMRDQVAKQMELNGMSEQQVLDEVFLKNQSIKKLTSPKQVGEMVLYLCSDAASTITGEAYNISGGWGM